MTIHVSLKQATRDQIGICMKKKKERKFETPNIYMCVYNTCTSNSLHNLKIKVTDDL